MIKALFKKLSPDEEDFFSDKKEKSIKLEYIDQYKEWEKSFYETLHQKPWKLQKFWGKKLVLQRCFALLAPTGIGKTSFGLASVVYFYKQNKRSYIILPTKLLVKQVYEKLCSTIPEDEIVCFLSDLTSQKKKEMKKKLLEGNYKVLITTSMFLYKNFSKIRNEFDFIFIDDVDSFLKSAKNIDKVLMLLGFEEKDINLALEYLRKINAKDFDNLEFLKNELQRIKNKRKGVLIVSSATSNPKGKRVKLFDILLDFEVRKSVFFLRNIEDVYEECKIEDMNKRLVQLIKKLGKNGLVFVASDYRKEYVYELKEFLKKNKIIAETYDNLNEEIIEKFKNKKIDVLIGISSYKNPLARGFDLPEIRYAIFYGVPKIEISVDIESTSLLTLSLTTIKSALSKSESFKEITLKIDKFLQRIRNQQNDYLLQEGKYLLKELLSNPNVINVLKNSEDISIKFEDGKMLIYVSDVTSYLQASGRTSRLFWKGLSKGLCYLLVDDKKSFNNLIKKSRWWLSDDIVFKHHKEVDLEKIVEEIDNDRKLLKAKPEEKVDLFESILVIVESPNKARTIANFFGKPMKRRILSHEAYEIITPNRYLVITSSLGHILDLSKTIGYYGVLENHEFIPVYEIISGKENIVNAIKEIAKEFDSVYIATDPDTEGEKIAWDLKNILSFFVKDIRRMEFHEVTKRAIMRALEETRDVDENLVKAQILRRISDRWVGFEISQILQHKFNNPNLSAGRVQTPVLGWIIRRHFDFLQKKYVITLKTDSFSISYEFDSFKDAKRFLDNAKEIRIVKEENFIEEINPLPPFSTDTILKEASRFKLSATKTMEILQDLFEAGLITYHRTDSIRVSEIGIGIAKQYISENFGEDYFKGRSWQEGGAHECIRPTKILDVEEIKNMIYNGKLSNFSNAHLLVYNLIFKRFIASQMKSIKVRKKKIIFECCNLQKELEVIYEIIEDGFNRIVPIHTKPLNLDNLEIREKRIYKLPKEMPYTQGSLVEEMKNRKIGRPSTYATVISKLLTRKYVVEKDSYLYPTKQGVTIYTYLSSDSDKFQFLTEHFTRELEEKMDLVESGKEDYQRILNELRKELKKVEVKERRNIHQLEE